MAALRAMLTISLVRYIHCYENICKRVTCTATQSSIRDGLSADKVIDGNTKQDYYSCSHTVVNSTSEAWVMVDLRKEYKLQNVAIYYRNEDDDLKVVKTNISRVWNSRRQRYEWRPYRFRQYSLEVSNSSDTEQWKECYKDNTPDSRIPSDIQNITCERTARYLRIITNYDAPEDDIFSESGPILEICEIQIYGNNEASENSKITDVHSVLYGVVTFLILSIFVNLFFIAWKVREKFYIRRDSTKEHGPYNSIRDANRDVYDRIEDIANYQELGQLSQPSQYEELKNNICERSICIATQSSISKDLSAYKVIDGNTKQNYASCSHTAVCAAPEAWVMVDLRKECKLQNVVIYYRNDIGYYTWRPYRFRQYSLQVSNSYDTEQWEECYKDNTPDSSIPSAIQNITCERTARYLRVITDYDAPEDDKFSERGAVLEICEIQIYGCDFNHYGFDCSMECSVNCKRKTCDIVNGSCTYGCYNGFYSEKCEKRCSTTCPSACNRHSGECEGPCPNGMYGHHCNFTCNQNCKNGCSKIDGLCTSGCIDGKFGANCLQTCGDGCISGCNQDDGNCFCKEGWQGQNCIECSQTHHGLECDKQCSPTCLNGTCFSNSGSCKDGFNVNNDKSSPAINQASASITNTEVYPVLYGVITVLIMSVILNIFLIVRNTRQRSYNTPDLNRDHNHANSTIDATSTIHERTEDNTNYEELGQSSQPSHYEELEFMKV
ncbi:uncharacterized protein LOC134230141 [Saccostrea cucullata]|uniref:uncharacterized protein LOC134230141 n=1 Tax=Saccostrea cuccullata TaxID=36930 RepID=UPI002ED4B522